MHIHNVYFWLNEDQTKADHQAFAHGLEQLVTDPNIAQSYFGPPADTHRDVVENSYSFGLVVVFDDLAAHERYQVSDIHEQFLANHAHRWAKVSVFDVAT